MRRSRVSLASKKDSWYNHASMRLDSARAMVYASMSSGSVKSAFAVRIYVRKGGVLWWNAVPQLLSPVAVLLQCVEGGVCDRIQEPLERRPVGGG